MSTLGLGNGNHTFCFWIQMPGDIDNSNDTACATYTLVDPVGVETREVQEYSRIYFVDGQLRLDVCNSRILGFSTLSVFSILGREIYSEPLTGNGRLVSTVNFSQQPKGVYIIRIVSNGKLIDTRKLIKE